MSFIQFLRILIARRWIILATLLSCVVVATTVASLLPKRYPASARIMLDVIKPDPVTGQIIANQLMRGYTRTQLELVTDYRVAGEVVDKLGLTANPAFVAQWQSQTGGTGDIRRWAAQQIADNTTAEMLQGSNILQITYTAQSPVIAKNVATMLREAYIDATLRFRTDAAGRTAEWYREQAEKARRLLIAAETAQNDFEKANNIVLGPGGLDPENSKLQALQQAMLAARTTEPRAQLSAQMSAEYSPQVSALNSQLASINDSISQAAQKYGTQHPTYKALMGRRATLQSELSNEIKKAQSMGGSTGSFAARNADQLEAEYEAQKVRVLAMQEKLSKLAQLQREVTLRRERFDKAAQRTADLRLEADVSETGLVVLGDVIGSDQPSYPNIPLVAGLSVAFGLGLGVVIALFSELMARRVRGAEDLAYASKVPVLAVIADGKRARSGGLIRRIFGRVGPQPKSEWQPAQ